jgi:4-amino-4-deoxy-L-arabinose transferase-like glycosyltransferase
LAAIVFISSLGVTAMSRILMFDMLLTVLLTAAVMSGYLFCVRKQRKLLYVCMAMLALALLAKGFVALILFFAVMGTYLALSSLTLKNFLSRLYECLHWKGLLVFSSLRLRGISQQCWLNLFFPGFILLTNTS